MSSRKAFSKRREERGREDAVAHGIEARHKDSGGGRKWLHHDISLNRSVLVRAVDLFAPAARLIENGISVEAVKTNSSTQSTTPWQHVSSVGSKGAVRNRSRLIEAAQRRSCRLHGAERLLLKITAISSNALA